METSLLKNVFIIDKRNNKQLLITHNEVVILHSFIKNTTNNEVMIINSNIGLEVYYLSSLDYGNLIKNTFLLITSKKGKEINQYQITTLNSTKDIKIFTENLFLKLTTRPLSFTCYSKSLISQINEQHTSKNTQIVTLLLSIWNQVVTAIDLTKKTPYKFKEFKKALANFVIKNSNSLVLTQLIYKATNSIRSN